MYKLIIFLFLILFVLLPAEDDVDSELTAIKVKKNKLIK